MTEHEHRVLHQRFDLNVHTQHLGQALLHFSAAVTGQKIVE